MPKFSGWLTATLGMPVVDETGRALASSKEFIGSPLVLAVREQLGLTLTNKRMPLHVLVVDQALSQPTGSRLGGVFSARLR